MCPFTHHSPLSFIPAPWYPTSDFSVILILKNFLQFFKISDCFSAMINTAYLSFLKILSSDTKPSNFLSTFMITISFSPFGSYSLGFFPLSVASKCLSLKIFFPISFPNISGSEVFSGVKQKHCSCQLKTCISVNGSKTKFNRFYYGRLHSLVPQS